MPTTEQQFEALQLTGLSPELKMKIKQEALKRNVTVSSLMCDAYEYYVKKYPIS